MKLLIVDDEQLTREGLLESIDWSVFGITEIYQADDGLHGLELARKQHPGIVISDIRMPRMNGIHMAEKLKEILPDSNLIFMSGYSDKEFLKAAIKLKAIRYVEKPINIEEIKEAISEAVEAQLQKSANNEVNKLNQLKTNEELAIKVLYQKNCEDPKLTKSIHDAGMKIVDNTYFTTAILQFHTNLTFLSEETWSTFTATFSKACERFHLHVFYGIKNDTYFICHFYSSKKISHENIAALFSSIKNEIIKISHFFISIGPTISDIKKLYESYHSAIIYLQKSFYYDYNSILTLDLSESTQNKMIDPNTVANFSVALSRKEEMNCKEILQELYHTLKQSKSLLPNIAKDIYYQLLTLIRDYTTKKQANSVLKSSSQMPIIDFISQYHTLDELHKEAWDSLEQYFTESAGNSEEDSIIFLIKEYIEKNFANEALSVKDISDYIHLSFSYTCTVFKNHTGKTLNQFITDVRMEHAKKLLNDPRNKVNAIAELVGYSDSNYFAKIFKKHIGVSPSEYRENTNK